MMKRTFDIETGRWTGLGSDSGRYGFMLRISDRPSRTVLADISLTPEQAFMLFTGGTLTVDGKQGNDLERVGKTMLTEVCVVPREMHRTAGRDKDETLRVSCEWAQREYPDWETYDARVTNSGVDVVMHRWVDEEASA